MQDRDQLVQERQGAHIVLRGLGVEITQSRKRPATQTSVERVTLVQQEFRALAGKIQEPLVAGLLVMFEGHDPDPGIVARVGAQVHVVPPVYPGRHVPDAEEGQDTVRIVVMKDLRVVCAHLQLTVAFEKKLQSQGGETAVRDAKERSVITGRF